MATVTGPHAERRFDAATHARLMLEAKSAGSTEQAWLYLEAAHIVGQLHLRPHLQTHAHMLGLSLRARDWPEAAGQMLRLALVPLGHMSGRLPLGNPGRSTVSAFEPLPVRPELADLIARASDD
ncbi:DUF3703 domain-containing protein [Hydrogenophaga sp. BPS33]|uniref:DUF3703 domain-containing protein n=1 Tax=Hydrogenophaga sp. BPS33 TaxID=2651974 RepID=UPI00131FF3F1|nr:DUF3703 domain-containing protein [Hydrogenophaga sp. BPS33]QHE89172.1 DUF3703 domain-containing protein [Hydrogenophaga sp. BPS33]